MIERELRSAARKRLTYWTRFGSAGAAFAICAWALWDGRFVDETRLGQDTFQAVSFVALLLTLLAGVTQTADAISEERREGTLGLLFLTDLRGGHVVLGKLVANSISSFLALAAILPALAIPFLLGGVSPGEMARVALLLCVALFTSLTAGLFASCVAKDDRITRSVALAVIVVGFLVPWNPLGIGNLFSAWSSAGGQQYLAAGKLFWANIAFVGICSALFLAMAAFLARRLWREQPGAPKFAGMRRRLARLRKRAARLDSNPMEWLAMRRNVLGPVATALAVGGILYVAADAFLGSGRIDDEVALVVTVSLHWIVKLGAALVAGGLLAKASREGALELILTTPLDPREALEGVFTGIARTFAPAVVLVVLLDLWLIQSVNFNLGSGSTFKVFLTIRIGIFLLDLATIAVFGVWSGLRSQRAGRAAFHAMWAVVFAPILFTIGCFFLRVGDSMAATVTAWIIWDVVLIARAWQDLRDLRGRASEGFRASSARA